MNLNQCKSAEEAEKFLKKKYIEAMDNAQIEMMKPNTSDFLYLDNSKLSGAGQGLFTKKAFKAGETICYYPPCAYSFISGIKNGKMEYIIKYSPEIPEEYKYLCKPNNINNYILEYQGVNLIGLERKYLDINNSLFWGHLVNDNNYNPKKKYGYNKHNSIFKLQPFEITTNSFKENLPVKVMAIKDIKENDEIFVSYGKDYWFNNIIGELSIHQKIVKSLSS